MRRVVVTGLGMVTPLGCGVDHTWKALLEGKSGAGAIKRFDASNLSTTYACEIPRDKNLTGFFDPDDWMEPKEQRKIDDFILYGVCAASQAIADSAWCPTNSYQYERTGVLIGSGIGGLSSIAETALLIRDRGPKRVSPFFIPGALINLISGQVSIKYGFKGPNHAVVTACSTGAHAIGDAARFIAFDDADVMIAGGAESPICEIGMAGFNACKALSTSRAENPETASRPWDKDRDGFVMGEGSGILVLEELEHALGRNADIMGEIVGYGASADAYHLTSPDEKGSGAIKSMKESINQAKINYNDIDYINAHGTSTKYNDRIETSAIKSVFKEHAYNLHVSSSKSMLGHLLGAAGALEAIISILSIKNSIIPPTINYKTPDPECDLNYVPNKSINKDIKYALSNTFGFGGHNSSLIFKRFN